MGSDAKLKLSLSMWAAFSSIRNENYDQMFFLTNHLI